MKYAINDIYTCIQGEGKLSGTPMILVRTQGCDVGCAFCDTKETWVQAQEWFVESPAEAFAEKNKWCLMTAEEIANYCDVLNKTSDEGFEWALITGGEPAEQNCSDMFASLKQRNYKIAVETSGTASGHLVVQSEEHIVVPDHICVSPKMKMNVPINKEVCEVADELKFVVGTEKDIEEIKTFISSLNFKFESCDIYLQPMSTNAKATLICVEACKKYGYKLSLQTHKWIGEK